MSKLTPLMEQYRKIKQDHQDKILLFRMGDFFEMFDEDAEIAAPILNIALTCRNKKSDLKTKMCGVPHHSISLPISKLLSAGWPVAICDQMESASLGKGLVKRAVTRVLSPGMVYDLETLDKLKANYMGAFTKKELSFLDLSTGSAFYYEVEDPSCFFKLLNQFQPRELVVNSSQKQKCSQSPLFQFMTLSLFDKKLSEHSLPIELQKYHSQPESAKRLLYYVYCMQGKESLKLIHSFEKQSLNKEMYCSHALYSHLEIFKNYEGSSKNTLFSSINRTKTPGGARLLRRRLQSPLVDQRTIEERLDQIDFWISKHSLLKSVQQILSQMGDGERKLGKLVQSTCQGRDLLAGAYMLDCGLEIEKLIENSNLFLEIEKARKIRDRIKHTISSSCPVSLKEGGVVNKGVNPQLDEWIDLTKSSHTHLLEMEKREQKKLGISSLKIRYNNIFGYYIEIRKIHHSKVPSQYRRKQTLVNAERYTTEELSSLEEKILSAKSKKIELEQQIFQDLKLEILKEMSCLMKLCYHWSQIDLYSSLAFLSIEHKYVRPQFTSHFKLVGSRHPVLEQNSFHEFVPNTIYMPRNQTLVLTGPNMAGKSTLMRQAALSVLMAQSACFVPADQAELPLFHKMFTRIGASDLLSQGLSTFMVEMKETAEILEKADEKSLIILDEIGRGTATFDGMSLAQSILEFLTVKKKPLLFSATHYQELTQLANDHDSICNASMAICEEEQKIRFLYFLKEGPANKSYGIQVARLAGLPESVVNRASQLLFQHENSSHHQGEKQPLSVNAENKANELKNKKSKILPFQSLITEISKYSLMTQSPIDAMNQIKTWQNKIKELENLSEKDLKTKNYNFFDEEFFSDNLN